MMRKHKYGRVIRRFVTPPALPTIIGPGTANRAEHVPPKNPGANVDESHLGDLVINARLTIIKAVHLPPDARVEKPFHQIRAVDTQRVLQILIWSCTIAVDGNTKTVDPNFGHRFSSCVLLTCQFSSL